MGTEKNTWYIMRQRQTQVLHIDDEPEFTDLSATFLEREDDTFSVETATSADSGLSIIDDRRPDCIVSDYNMPGMDGLEFLRAVREEYPELPFILFTGEGSESIASDAIASGVTDYLQKGAGSDRYKLLANRIRNAVQSRREAQRADRREQLMRLTEFAGDTGGFEFDRENDTVLLTAGSRRIIDSADKFEFALEEALALFHPDERDTIKQTLEVAFETGEHVDDTWRLQSGAGQERLIDVRIVPVVENGEVTKLRGAGQDVTGHRRRTAELEQYETIIDTLSDAVYVLDEAGQFSYVNDKFVKLVGYDRDRIIGNTPSLLKDEDAVEQAEQQLGRLLSSDGPHRSKFEVAIQPRDGDPIVCEDHMGVLPYEGDSFEGSVGTLRDITRVKERERQLERQNDLFRRAQDIADVGAWEHDYINQEIHLSEQVYDIYGVGTDYDPDPEADIEQFYHPDDRDTVREATKRAVEVGEDYDIEVRITGADGTKKWVRTRGEPEFANGTCQRVRGTMQDITVRKERERELRQQKERLEKFASVVSHDLRNPLNVVSGRVELVQEEFDSPHFGTIEDAVTRMERIIDDLLWLAHEGRDIGETQAVALRRAAENLWPIVSDTSENADLVIDGAGTQAVIDADADRLSQLLENIFRNAIDHGGSDVTVRLELTDTGFAIEDDGPGIPTDEREHVLKTGYSTDESGTGLGLSIVARVAEAHGWELAVTEGSAGGARFEITGVEFTRR